MDLGETVLEGMDFIRLAQDTVQWWALVNTIMNLRVRINTWNFLSS
jgi:hypothetical protein